MNVINVIVTGSTGQLGSELKDLAAQFPDLHLIFLSRSDLSLENRQSLEEIFKTFQPRYFINCAAYTAVDKAEEETDLAFEINGTAVGLMAALCKQHDCKFIHISTDYVFDGQRREALTEADSTDPVNAYGRSKRRGEELALEHNPDSVIIRTSWVYSFYGKNFVKTMLRLMKEKESIGVVSDQIGSPTYAADLARTILEIIGSGKWVPGIFHFSNEGVFSWYDFAIEIKKIVHSSCLVKPLSTDQFPTPAKRPAYSVMDKEKIQRVYGIHLHHWKESLRICLDKLQANETSVTPSPANH